MKCKQNINLLNRKLSGYILQHQPPTPQWHFALQWRHNGRDGVTTSRLFTQPFIQTQIKGNIKSSASLAIVWGIHRWPVTPHKWPVTRIMFPFDDVIMAFGASHWDMWKFIHGLASDFGIGIWLLITRFIYDQQNNATTCSYEILLIFFLFPAKTERQKFTMQKCDLIKDVVALGSKAFRMCPKLPGYWGVPLNMPSPPTTFHEVLNLCMVRLFWSICRR